MDAMSILTNVRVWIFSGMIIGLIFGDIGGENDATILTIFLMTMMCFSLSGLKFNKDDLGEYKKKVAIAVICSSLISFGITILVGLFYGKDMWNGWVILACVPCAISVVSGTLMAKGDMKLITLSITAVYILALVLTPVLSYLLIGDAIDPLQILKYVLLFILVPFIVSRIIGKIGIPSNANHIIINICFFVFVIISFGRCREILIDYPLIALAVIAGCAVRIFGVFFASEYGMRKIGVRRDTRIPYIFMLFWKNSGLALTMTMVLFPNEAYAIIPPAISMFVENIFFIFFIWYYEKRMPPETAVAGTY